VDDFGTGYSSLSHLRRLPLDELKIDRSFVLQMIEDDSDQAMVRATIDLAHNLGMRVIAEGIEDQRTWLRLAELGCDAAQGHLVAAAMSPQALLSWIASNNTRELDERSQAV